MFKKLFTVTFVAVLLLSAFLSAQDHSVLRPDGKIIKYKGDLKNLEVQSIKGQKSGNQLVTDRYSGGNSLLLGTIDTLRYPGLTTSNFGIFGQEWLLQWIDLSILGYPQLLAGDIFAVAIKHAGPTFDINRIGFWAGAQSGFPGWKFYANGNANLPPDNDWGWWSREFTFDMAGQGAL